MLYTGTHLTWSSEYLSWHCHRSLQCHSYPNNSKSKMDFIQFSLKRRQFLDSPWAYYTSLPTRGRKLYVCNKGTAISEHGKSHIPRSIFPTQPSQFCYLANQVVQRTFHSSLTAIAVLLHPLEGEFTPSTSLALACDQSVAWQNPLVLYMVALAEDLHGQTHDPVRKWVVSGGRVPFLLKPHTRSFSFKSLTSKALFWHPTMTHILCARRNNACCENGKVLCPFPKLCLYFVTGRIWQYCYLDSSK